MYIRNKKIKTTMEEATVRTTCGATNRRVNVKSTRNEQNQSQHRTREMENRSNVLKLQLYVQSEMHGVIPQVSAWMTREAPVHDRHQHPYPDGNVSS